LTVTAELAEPEAPPVDPRSPFSPGWTPRASHASGHLQFSLESLFLVTTLIAVCLGALVAVPPLGVLAILVAGPALVRTLVEGHYARQAGRAMNTGDKLMAFIASTGVTLAALIAAGGAFFTVCTGSLIGMAAVGEMTRGRGLNNAAGGMVIWGCIVLCLLATGGAFAGVLWMLRPRRQG
jgi:hypothetical protein